MKNYDDIMDEQAGRNFTDEAAAWDDETACREYEEWLDSDPRRVMDEASGFGVAYVAVSPNRYLTPETMPLPEECRPLAEMTTIVTLYGTLRVPSTDIDRLAEELHRNAGVEELSDGSEHEVMPKDEARATVCQIIAARIEGLACLDGIIDRYGEIMEAHDAVRDGRTHYVARQEAA